MILLILSCYLFIILTKDVPVVIKPSDDRIVYGGRWENSVDHSDEVMKADWTCSDVTFTVRVGSSGGKLPIVWYGERVRMNVTGYDPSSGKILLSQLFVGPWLEDPLKRKKRTVDYVDFSAFEDVSYKNVTISMKKLTTAEPYGTGLGSKFIHASMTRFYGMGEADGDVQVIGPLIPKMRRIISIGASDTAGYCVDGTADMKEFDTILTGWEYVNCKFSYPTVVGSQLNAHVDVQAISGIGLTQNAYADEKWQLGKLTMPSYFNRTLQSESDPLWDFKNAPKPDLITISLGGNDYNHQGGNVPSNQTFTDAYASFMTFLFDEMKSSSSSSVFDNEYVEPVIINVCGMGDPEEVKFDPDNNRCRPCPHVEDAVDYFKATYPSLSEKVYYIFIPCDGTVVTGNGDIGCDGHKNRIGQQEVADFLAPKIKEIMNW